MNAILNLIYNYGFIASAVTAICALTITLAKFVHYFTAHFDRKLEKTLEQTPKSHVQVPDFKVDATHYRFFKHIIIALIYLIGGCLALSMIPQFRNFAYSLLAGSGLASIIMTSFASRETFSNIISGLCIEIFRPFEIGNHIKVDKDIEGHVKDITLYHTVLRTAELNHIMIPNSVIATKSIENVTLPKEEISVKFELFLSYEADLDKALTIVQKILEAHPLIIDKRTENERKINKPIAIVNIEKLMRTSIHVVSRVYARNEGDAYQLTSDCYKKVKKSFDMNKIPFARSKAINKELSV